MTAPGVGTIVVLGYITGVETPARFTRSSAVGAYFGMTPRRYQSGEVDTAGRVSKCGDGMVRGLLFEGKRLANDRIVFGLFLGLTSGGSGGDAVRRRFRDDPRQ
jgi:transposase